MARKLLFAITFAVTALVPVMPVPGQAATQAKKQPPSQKKQSIQLPSNHSPLVFEPNRGQAEKDIQWLARAATYTVGITSDGATVAFRQGASTPSKPLVPTAAQLAKPAARQPAAPSTQVKLHVSGSGGWKPEGMVPTGGISNYFLGNKSANWHTNIPHYAQVKLTGIYNGVDLVFHGDQSSLEYDFVVAPGADPRQIELQFEGAASLKVDASTGDLVVAAPGGAELRHAQPKISQQVGGKKVSVKGGFEVRKEGSAAGFTLGTYDSKLPLVIDPTILFTTFLGGSNADEAYALAVDGLGNTFVTGETNSNNFIVRDGLQTGNAGGSDAFVTKLSPNGQVLFSTYLGGGDDDHGYGIAVDASGVYIGGATKSSDFPMVQPFQGNSEGSISGFVTKMSLLGNMLIYSTYLQGSNGAQVWAIAIDPSQAVYAAGFTTSTDFPIRGVNYSQNWPIKGGYEESQHAGDFTPIGFVAKLSPAGTSLEYSTYLGGSILASISGIAVDSTLAAIVTGETCSSDFPYAGYNSLPFPGTCVAFVTKLSPAGDSLLYSTSLGPDSTNGAGIAVDPAGNAYIGGVFCSGCPKTEKSLAFLAKVTPTGALGYLRYLTGNDGSTAGWDVAVDAEGDTYLVGSTSSTTLPDAPPITPNPTAGFLVKYDKNGNGPLYTVFLGAEIRAVAVVRPKPRNPALPTVPTIYTAGRRFSGGTQPSNQDAFVVKLDESTVVENH